MELIALRISSKDILEPDAFAALRDRIVVEVSEALPEVVAGLHYKKQPFWTISGCRCAAKSKKRPK